MNDLSPPSLSYKHTIDGGEAAVDRLLAGIARRAGPPLHKMNVASARKAYEDVSSLLDIAPVPDVVTTSMTLPREDASPSLEVRVSTPLDTAPRRVLLWVHGGGFCLGSAEAADALCQWFAQQLQAAVVAVGYRLAPEHTLVDAQADVDYALAWARAAWPDLPLSVLGESAGASLALPAVAQAGAGGGSLVDSLVLVYPLVQLGGHTPSRERYGQGHFLTVPDLAWMHALAGLTDDGRWLPGLVRKHWPTMPRTLVVLAHRDPLFSEGEALAGYLNASGVPVSTLHLPALIHGCLHMGGLMEVARTLHEHLAVFLQAHCLRDAGATTSI